MESDQAMDATPGGEEVHCRRCRYYYITWDAGAPHGCKAMGFKSRKLPCEIVLEDSGMTCQAFKPKERK